jgi:hypothetical protein
VFVRSRGLGVLAQGPWDLLRLLGRGRPSHKMAAPRFGHFPFWSIEVGFGFRASDFEFGRGYDSLWPSVQSVQSVSVRVLPPVSGLQSLVRPCSPCPSVFFLRSPVSGLQSPVSRLRSQVSCVRAVPRPLTGRPSTGTICLGA